MEEQDITAEALGESSQLNDAPAETAVETEGKVSDHSAQGLSLDEINSHLGKDFKDKATALKAFKDTFSYVGKKREDILKELDSAKNTEALTAEIKLIKENMFYDRNPEYAQYRTLIDKLGENPEKVINSSEFKSVYEKAKGFDESAKLKTVLQSSPRLASAQDSLSKAREALSSGNRDKAEDLIARAVLDSSRKD
jgi:hypothetical protein